ncbi:GL21693 [Drosophila persimilis]|uniref:GL21693 n=1 Tax=Drosophila persimilis TaxID=7234 RepID=B4GF36_DROPE|nr:GL21693 [Drosophila persimilis]
MLVRRAANVNSTTRTNSTPLRAACFDGHYEIVKYLVHHGADFEVANRHGHTCLMIACYKGHYRIAQYLLSLNADVNRCSVKGNTALHDCAESGSLQILQLLLKHGATMDVDYYGMTPLLAASVTGHMPIVEHLITLPCVSRESRIHALELLGATYVDRKRDMAAALNLWRRALEERNVEPPLTKKVQEPVPAYEMVREVTNVEELEEMVLDPDEMRMQALVIRQRILGPTHPDTRLLHQIQGCPLRRRWTDTKNFAGETFESLLGPTPMHKIIDPMKYTTLACLAARTIKRNDINYEGTVPETLYDFIELH